MKKANFYVDGFNLYFGLVQAKYLDCKWLNIYSLAQRIKNHSHDLNVVKYFTSRVNNNVEKQKRQNSYLEALQTTPISIIYGQFRSEPLSCKICGNTWFESKEKMTDVNIATNLIIDAYRNDFDVAFIISGDSDLVPPVKEVKNLFPQKEIIIAFPPERKSNELKMVANSSFSIGKSKFLECQLPLQLENKYGDKIEKPSAWR